MKTGYKRLTSLILTILMVVSGIAMNPLTADALPKVTAEVSTKGLNYNSAKALDYAKKQWNINAYAVDCINFVRRCNAAGGVTTKSCTIPHYIEYLTEGGFAEYNKLTTKKVKIGSKTKYYLNEKDNKGKVAPGDTVVFVCNKCGKLWHVGIAAPPDKTGDAAGYYRFYAHNGPQNNALLCRYAHGQKCHSTTEQTALYAVHFKSIENGYVNTKGAYTVKVTDEGVNMREGPGTTYKSQGQVAKGKEYVIREVKGKWGRLATNNMWICLDYTVKTSGIVTAFNVIVDKITTPKTTASKPAATTAKTTAKASAKTFKIKPVKNLNMRKGAGTNYKKKGLAKKGKTYTVKAVKNGWGQLSGGYWVALKYAKVTSGYKVRISDSDLNLRTGPGVKYKRVGYAKKGTYKVVKISGGWCKLSNGYWVSMKYAKRV